MGSASIGSFGLCIDILLANLCVQWWRLHNWNADASRESFVSRIELNTACYVSFKRDEHEAYRQIHWRLEEDRWMRIVVDLNGKRFLFQRAGAGLDQCKILTILGLCTKRRKARELLYEVAKSVMQ
jgi:hypothetical protein